MFPPPAGGRFAASVTPVPATVLARSTWQPGCPVRPDDLRYLRLSFWGFDDRPHTGEMIVNARVADAVARVFERLYAARFPIEEMRVVARPELTLHPTGDGNNTTAFVCRPATGLNHWSAHAFGLAIDLNPFCNPYVKGNLVLPELASSYVDRRVARPGMVFAGDVAVRSFAVIGWGWGGTWTSPLDIQHFTATGN
ncbi:D-alanyl-D-alanine carboxypeptidase-like protein [Herbihabitans rhizosphaerae]|uniref:D-alanyl-D-alanine carboxypeptidase-like protein n=2 Tax=Herbihabitans rhizosphaerae TaxID=1872711 RepID=A0A4Q7KF67_9PSEU|nr:D-alanyl-D-alanine carboxypeptidase-like protein [Herbihabitans rhizosphaerae]